MSTETSPVRLLVKGAIAVITIDNPPVNAMSGAVRKGLIDTLTKAARDEAIAAIVLTGAGQNFVAGADIREMSGPPVPPHMPEVIAIMEGCGKPIVAAINGAALGGGLELALPCDLRLASPRAAIGLPETRLGIVPGAGGTQRLPRLVGVAKAIEMITQARVVWAPEAQALGIVDRLVDGDVVAAACEVAAGTAKRRLSEMAVPAGDTAAVEAAAKAAERRARGNPAIAAAIDLVKRSASEPIGEMLLRERDEFLRLRETDEAKALRHLFFAEREAAKIGLGEVKAREVRTVAVIGGGTMGSGIAVSFADAGFPVALIERDADAAAVTAKRIDGLYDGQVASGRLTADTARDRRGRIDVAPDWSGVAAADLVIEAVFEDYDVKAEVLRRIDDTAAPQAIIATNTSYLDVNRLAAFTRRPEAVVGLHFFAPANVMRLLEVVRAERTAPDVLATAFALGKRLGKLPVLAGVCDGFIGNRIYSVYRRHAEYLVEDGASPRQVDQALERYGFAMGLFAVNDLSGLDIAWAMRKRRAAERPAAERYVAIADRLCEQGRLGRKTGGGWYRYEQGSSKPVEDPEVADIIAAERAAKGITPREFSDEAIVRRLIAAMANEGAKVLAERIALRASDIDLVFINGYGFPSVRGGPMFAADLTGLDNVLREVEAAAAIGGAGSEPAPLLYELAKAGSSFQQWDREHATV